MATTIKIEKETKERLLSLDLSEKGKTFDMLVNDLITFYNKSKMERGKNLKKWGASMKAHQERIGTYDKEMEEYNKRVERLNNLLKWAKTKGFKG